MNPPTLPARRFDPKPEDAPANPPGLHLAPVPGPFQRFVWEGRFATMVIEVRDGLAYVNGQVVEPARL